MFKATVKHEYSEAPGDMQFWIINKHNSLYLEKFIIHFKIRGMSLVLY